MRNALAGVAILILALLSGGPVVADVLCKDAKVLSGKLITDICWECMLPLRVAGFAIGGGSGEAPPGATNQMLCSCEDNLGVPMPGFVTSMWEPARLIEVVRQGGCAPSLGGVSLPLGTGRFEGMNGSMSDADADDIAFMQLHYYNFPLLMMLELFIEDRCMANAIPDFDLLFMTELDPTWNNSDLAFFTHAESAATANPAAIEACAIEAMKMSTGDWPIDHMYWCLGSWGTLYPLTGQQAPVGGYNKLTAKLAARQVAAMHRRGLERKTFGEGALCDADFAPMLPKTQYRISHFWPLADANRAEKVGSLWQKLSQQKNVPGMGDDGVMVLWRYNDCCVTW